jgi:hypothetical protein
MFGTDFGEREESFLGDSGFETNLSFFQPYCMLAGFAATPGNDMFELVLDARSRSERILTRDARLLLRSLRGPG